MENSFNELTAIEFNGKQVFTTNQIALHYGCTPKVMIDCFRRHKVDFIENVDYFHLVGEPLLNFKQGLKNQQGLIAPSAASLHLWTKFGALKLSKFIGTDKAKAIYTQLAIDYF